MKSNFNMLLKDKTILITGASRGIGRAISVLFSEQGANVILTGRDEEKLNSVKSSLSLVNDDQRHNVYQMDVKYREQINDVFKDLLTEKIYIDCLVNNAGIMEDATLQMVKEDMINNTFDTNVFGSIRTSQMAIKAFLRNKKGSIINLSSIIGTNGNSGQTVYGSSKAAIVGFTKSLSKELARFNIRVNAIAPGFIDTDMTANMKKKNIESIGLGRIGTPEDVAKVALFLASDLSEYITGQVIGVDGGMII
jgi:3-oxoacyl-[acyl-carrier protein] reductase